MPPAITTYDIIYKSYSLEVRYRPGKEHLLSDALSRFPTKVVMTEGDALFHINVLELPPISEEHLRLLKEATVKDKQLQVLRQYVDPGWLEHREQVPLLARTFWPQRRYPQGG